MKEDLICTCIVLMIMFIFMDREVTPSEYAIAQEVCIKANSELKLLEMNLFYMDVLCENEMSISLGTNLEDTK